jgi:nucleoside-diphosphate-sugar epimerase
MSAEVSGSSTKPSLNEYLSNRRILVTGGTGFIGSAAVRALVKAGARVRVMDNDSRGSRRRLADLEGQMELVVGDIREPAAVKQAARQVDAVLHLAAVNGTEFFYSKPELVLEVAVKGMMNVLDACIENGVRELFTASSSEVYQTPPVIPTNEAVPLSVPDPLNPRYSYGGGKIISELLTVNYGRKHLERAVIFRPHNVYGPDMGREHVIPQFALRLKELAARGPGRLRFPIQGSGKETRAFLYIDDFVQGLLTVMARGEHLNIYHIGTGVETAIADLAQAVAQCVGREIEVVPGDLTAGSTSRRCPDIGKLRALGFAPQVPLATGLARTLPWYLSQSA